MSKKSKKQITMLLSGDINCETEWLQCNKIISDRGSVYSATGGKVKSRENLKDFLKKLKKDKKYFKATHNSWAARISNNGGIFETKSDDGETGAGQVILHQLRHTNLVDVIVVVTRWYGGIKLQSDRFSHLKNATIFWLEEEKKRT